MVEKERTLCKLTLHAVKDWDTFQFGMRRCLRMVLKESMIKKSLIIGIMACLCIGSAGSGWAENEEIVATLDEVVVTSSRMEEAIREVTSQVTIVGEQEIKMSAARDLGDILAEKNIGHIHVVV
ncbi:MAG: hypothetical protein U5J62_02345 [Desulfurivibrio sp.]|nr:hypothetical protein [Desulfurivibrio sp.]